MDWAYHNCTNLKIAACGNQVRNMQFAYQNCINLTTAACSGNVENMAYAYCNCISLTEGVCGWYVHNMQSAFQGCTNLTKALCYSAVSNMARTYLDCVNLTEVVCNYYVSNMYETYKNCVNIHNNAYLTSPNITNMTNCFYGRNTSKILNIFVNAKTISNECAHITTDNSIVGTNIVWESKIRHFPNGLQQGYSYNATYNIAIYPVVDINWEEENRIPGYVLIENTSYLDIDSSGIATYKNQLVYPLIEKNIDVGYLYEINIDAAVMKEIENKEVYIN
jgi:hypothetical protein